MKKSLLLLLTSCLAFFSDAQPANPKLVASGANNVFQYIGGDTTVSIYSPIAYVTPRSATLIETPDGKLYGSGLGGGSNYGGIVEYDYPTNTYNHLILNFGISTGTNPFAPLLLTKNGQLYGTAWGGGANNGGTIFSYTVGGTSITKLVDLPSNAEPYGAMIQATDSNLYGMTQYDGTYSSGTIYRYNISTSAYTVLYNLPNAATPKGALLEIGADTLYGLTYGSGSLSIKPVIFRFIATTGVYTVLDSLPLFTYPKGGLIRATDGNLYGLTSTGGSYSNGTMFRYNMAIGTIDTLHNFGSGTDGTTPQGELYQASDGMLYGITSAGGANGQGTIFQYNIASSTYALKVHMTSPVVAAYYGHLMEYKVLPVRRHPVATSLCAGHTASFIAADTSRSATAQWQVSSDSGVSYTNISGATDTIYSFMTTSSQNGNLYRAIFTHNGQSDTSLPAALTVWPIDTTYIDTSICYGQSVTVYFTPYSTPGSHIINLPGSGVHGCDSMIRLNLTVYPQATDTITASTCINQGYTLRNNTYYLPGSYTDTLYGQSMHGCDSLVILNLSVYPVSTDSITGLTCPGTGYAIGTHTYTTTGIYIDTLVGASVYGCDSIVILSLAVLDSSLTSYFSLHPSSLAHYWYAINQCFGNQLSYQWNWGDGTPNSTGNTPSHSYASPGYYTICVTVTDSMGCAASYCDSNVYLYKDADQMIQVNVVLQAPDGINAIMPVHEQISYYGGEVHFSKALTVPVRLGLYDLSGREVMAKDDFYGDHWNINANIVAGVYIIRLQNGGYNFSQKLVISPATK